MMKNKMFVTGIIIAGSIFMTACSPERVTVDSPASGHYSAQAPATALEYSIYINKQVNVFLSHIMTRMQVSQNLASDGYELEIQSTESSLSTLQDVLDEVIVTMPSFDSEDQRDAVITAMQTTITHMEEYLELLKTGQDVSVCTDTFSNDFSTLSGYATLYTQ